jgi:hypothetical protein
VCARVLPLLDDGDGDVAEPLLDLRRGLEQLGEADGAREPGRPGAHEQHAHLDPVVGAGLGDVQELGVVNPGPVVAGYGRHAVLRKVHEGSVPGRKPGACFWLFWRLLERPSRPSHAAEAAGGAGLEVLQRGGHQVPLLVAQERVHLDDRMRHVVARRLEERAELRHEAHQLGRVGTGPQALEHAPTVATNLGFVFISSGQTGSKLAQSRN